MYILVDKMPSVPSDCDFAWYDLDYGIDYTKDNFICSLSKDNHTRYDRTADNYNVCSLSCGCGCPYLKALTNTVKEATE